VKTVLVCFVFRKYTAGIASVDNIVSQVEQVVNDYYGDGQTLFIFTSDHGMTNWGKIFTYYYQN